MKLLVIVASLSATVAGILFFRRRKEHATRVVCSKDSKPIEVVVFACTHNAGRSQLSAALFSMLANPQKATCISAGTQPGTHVYTETIAVMKELGYDLSNAKPQLLTKDLMRGASLVVTMGCGEGCPYSPGVGMLNWPLEDPHGKSVEEVRVIRDQIRAYVEDLIAVRGWGRDRGRDSKVK